MSLGFRFLVRLVLVGLVVAAPPVSDADHLPDNKVARGKEDSILCGIGVKATSVSDLTKLLGEPTIVREDTRIWKKSNIKVEVGIDQMLNADNSPGAALYLPR